MLVKRVFFKAFWEEIYRSDKHAPPTSSGNTAGAAADAEAMDIDPKEDNGREQDPQYLATDDAGSTPAPEEINSTPTPLRRSTRSRAEVVREDTPLRPTTTSSRGNANRKKQVRSNNAHEVWLQDNFEMKVSKSKIVISGWRALGFLDEEWFKEWIQQAGMFENDIGGEARE
jgi:hypothetical protein